MIDISVIMPVYNAEKFVAESIEGVLKQTYQNWELIIINDGSTDNSTKIINDFLVDRRIKFIKNENNLGIPTSINKALVMCKGKYVAFNDSDDVSVPDRLKISISILEAYKNCKFIFSPAIFIDTNGIPFTQWGGEGLIEGVQDSKKLFELLYKYGNLIPNCSTLIRVPLIPYVDRYTIVNDFFNYLQLLHSNQAYFCKEALIKIRRGRNHNSLSSNKNFLFGEERKLLKEIKNLYGDKEEHAVLSSYYNKAMSNQSLKEARFYLKKGEYIKARILRIESFFYKFLQKGALMKRLKTIFNKSFLFSYFILKIYKR